MRQRIIKPDFWSDENMGKLSFGARLAYIASWNLADDEGRLRGALPYLHGHIFPFDERVDISKIRAALIKLGKWVPYEVDGKPYLMIPKFKKYQKISRPRTSNIPGPQSGTEVPSSGTQVPDGGTAVPDSRKKSGIIHEKNQESFMKKNVNESLNLFNEVASPMKSANTDLSSDSEKLGTDDAHLISNINIISNINTIPGGCKGGDSKFTIPENLNTPEFLAAWNDWLVDRKARRKSVTPIAAKLQLKGLSEMGSFGAVNRIRLAITNGWTGLIFEDDRKASKPLPQSSALKSAPAPARAKCIHCGWSGFLADVEELDDDRLGCPECKELIG